MKIAVLSGKGGTGKTTLATNLAELMGYDYADLDVEEPNGHIFLKPVLSELQAVEIPTPVVDSDRCTLCGICTKTCQFNALLSTGRSIRVFEDLCHGCGACKLACPKGAIEEYGRKIGIIEKGRFENGAFVKGLLNLKEPMAGPIISRIKKGLSLDSDVFLDCSPGTSCNVVKALDGVNYALLVTEPSTFGLHDLKLAVRLVSDLSLPHGIVINRSNEYDHLIDTYAEESGIPVVGRIPFSREAARLYSEGKMLIQDLEIRNVLEGVGRSIVGAVKEADHAIGHHQR